MRMRRPLALPTAAALAIGALFTFSPGIVGAAGSSTCDGNLSPGNYTHLVVPAGAVCTHLGGGQIAIRGGVFVGEGATLVLGSEDEPGTTSTITGGIHAANAMNVQVHFATISGGVRIKGGSGPVGGPFGISWNTIEDSHINGGATIQGYNGFWMGFIRNHVAGSVHLNDNVLVDPDGNEYVTNVIRGGMQCSGNSPAPQTGDSGGGLNVVSGAKKGQCAGV